MYLKKWFLGAPAEEIERENAMVSSCGHSSIAGDDRDDYEELGEYMTRLDDVLGKPI